MPSIGNIVLPQTEKVGVVYTSDGPINDSWFGNWFGNGWTWFYIIVVVILVIIVLCMLFYLLYKVSCCSTTSLATSSTTLSKDCFKEKKVCSPKSSISNRIIREFTDDEGKHQYEYKLDKSVFESACDPGFKQVKEYNVPNSTVNIPTIATPVVEKLVSPVEPTVIATPVVEKIVSPSIVTAATPVTYSRLPTSSVPVLTEEIVTAPKITIEPSPVKQIPSNSRLGEQVKSMGMDYYGTAPSGSSLYTPKESNSPKSRGYKTPLDLLKTDA